MDIKVSAHHFSREEPIQFIYFLGRLVREPNLQEMSETQAFLALPFLLTGLVKSQYEAGIKMVDPQDGGISSWPEATQYFLRYYALSKYIAGAIGDLRSIKQEVVEQKCQFATRLNKALVRCENVFPQEKILHLYGNGKQDSTLPLVADYVEKIAQFPIFKSFNMPNEWVNFKELLVICKTSD